MNNCRKNKPKHNCGIRTPATCVFYNLELPEISKLKVLEDCITIEETTEDIYNILDFIIDDIDTSELGKKCLDYKKSKNKYRPDKEIILVKDVLLKLEDVICELKDKDSNNCDTIDKCFVDKLDFKCLIDPCNDNINSLSQLLQILINEICDLKQQI